MIISLVLIFLTLALLYLYFTWHNNHWAKLRVPHIKPQIFVGNTPNGLLQKRNAYYDIQDVFEKFRSQYQIAGFYSFRKPTLLILDPSLARQVFLTEFNKFAHNDFASIVDKDVDPILGYNPFFLNGAEWKERRAEVTPAFTVSRLRSMYPLVEDVCHNLIDHIDRESRLVGDNGFDARELSAKYTTDVVSSCIFALDAGALNKDVSVIRNMAKEMFKPSFRLVVLLLLSEICPKLNRFLRIPFIPKNVEDFFAKLMKDAADHRRSSKLDKTDVMQYLLTLQDRKNLNDVELVANAITFFLDGYETSSVSMALILFELARDKRVQDKLRKEIMDAEVTGKLTLDAMADLRYLDQVVYEALRLNPPTPFLIKKCTADCEMPLTRDGREVITVTEGTSISIPLFDIQRDPDNFKDPLEFIPERFDEEHGGVKAFKDKGCLLIFGMGPRECLGKRFAMMQMKSAIVEIIRSYEVSLNVKTQVPLVIDPKEFLNVPQGGVWVDFKRL